MKYTLTEIVKQKAEFESLRCNTAYYKVAMPDGTVYSFNIALSDIGQGTLLAKDKAIYFMRWIRKCIDSNELLEDGKLCNIQQS